jgi:hypothetical protein
VNVALLRQIASGGGTSVTLQRKGRQTVGYNQLETYIESLATETALLAKAADSEERQNLILNKMALLQTYLTSTGETDAEAFALCRRFQSKIERLLEQDGGDTLKQIA